MPRDMENSFEATYEFKCTDLHKNESVLNKTIVSH